MCDIGKLRFYIPSLSFASFLSSLTFFLFLFPFSFQFLMSHWVKRKTHLWSLSVFSLFLWSPLNPPVFCLSTFKAVIFHWRFSDQPISFSLFFYPLLCLQLLWHFPHAFWDYEQNPFQELLKNLCFFLFFSTEYCNKTQGRILESMYFSFRFPRWLITRTIYILGRNYSTFSHQPDTNGELELCTEKKLWLQWRFGRRRCLEFCWG